MVKLLALTILFLSLNCFALEGTVTVLEAPLFSVPDETSKVIQYLRKGEYLYVHPREVETSVYNDTKFDHTSEAIKNKNPDPLFPADFLENDDPSGKFYKTISKSGNEAYILREHVFINFNDKRELEQEINSVDNTDYRISEPLPEDYPLLKQGGYKGMSSLGFGRPTFGAYNYNQNILDSGFDLAKELSFTWSRAELVNQAKRFFFGAKGSIYFGRTTYLLTAQEASQQNFRIAIGPYASYDAYRNKKTALNLSTSFQFIALDRMEITIKDSATNESEIRDFDSAFGIIMNLAGSYQVYDFFDYFDLVLGTNINILTTRTYKANDSKQDANLWGPDQYEQPFNIEINYFLGLQSYY